MKIILEPIEGISEEVLNQLEESLKNVVVDHLGQNLNLELLEFIIVPADFDVSLTNFQKKHGLTIGYTNNEMGVAGGKTLKYIKDTQHKCSIFLQQYIFVNLFDPAHGQLASNFLHHELCHVHDEANILNMKQFHKELTEENQGYLTNTLNLHSHIIWDEYIAPRLSSGTLPKDTDLQFPYLLELIEHANVNCKKEISKYRSHRDVSYLFNRVQELSNPVLKIAATVLGNIHGLQLENSKVMEIVDETIENTFLKDIWNELKTELLSLFIEYPNWESISVFSGLNAIVIKVWNQLGIYPEDRGESAYIDVPW